MHKVAIIATVAMKYRFVLKVNHDSTPDYSIVILQYTWEDTLVKRHITFDVTCDALEFSDKKLDNKNGREN